MPKDTCDPLVLIALSLIRSKRDNRSLTDEFRKECKSGKLSARGKNLIAYPKMDQFWDHIRNEHKEWAEFVSLHCNEESFDYVLIRLFTRDWADLEVLEKRAPTFEGLKNMMNDLIDLDSHLETKEERSKKQEYESRYFCPA
ncbi:hypothetical protein MMC26_004377 [Xylographa opegraphella]|nr:hypothetical protein [Xylographa opegraphella]